MAVYFVDFNISLGWSGGAMVLGKLPLSGRPSIWIIVGAGWGCLDIFILLYLFSPLSPFLWEMAQYRLKYCLKGSLNPKQHTNQPIQHILLNLLQEVKFFFDANALRLFSTRKKNKILTRSSCIVLSFDGNLE